MTQQTDGKRASDVRTPSASEDAEGERRRVRSSNDRDQQQERQGEDAPHNRGYDEAADGTPADTVSGLAPDDAE